MGIDVSRLSPAAQKQIAQKLIAQNREKEARNKYHASPTEVEMPAGKHRFDSKAEARRYAELMLMLKAGDISDLKLQPQFSLQESYITPEGNRVRAIKYVADFSYWQGGELIVEDVKSKATKTRAYAIKRKLMQERFGITIKEVS